MAVETTQKLAVFFLGTDVDFDVTVAAILRMKENCRCRLKESGTRCKVR
jgi:hypothetical protein